MRILFALAAALALTAGAAEVAAQAIPAERFGIWAGPVGEGDGDGDGNASGSLCAEPRHAFLVGPGVVLAFRNPATVFGSEGKVVAAEAQYRDGALEVARVHDGAVRSVTLPDFATLQRCQSLPGAAQVGFGEAIAFFDAMVRLHAVCAEGAGPACAAAIFSEIDVTGDGRLSEAEILRAARGVGLFSALLSAELPLDWDGEDVWGMSDQDPTSLAGGTMAASLFGPIVVGALIRSYDYDGDGFLSLDEILQDRTGADLRDAIAMQPGAAEAIGEALEGLRSASEVLPLLLGRPSPF